MNKIVATVFAQLLSIAAILKLFLSLSNAEQQQFLWQISVFVICAISIAAIVWETSSYYQNMPTKIKLQKRWKIKKYMKKWISSGGRAVVFTRDMSWVDEFTKELLFEKAAQRELIICIQEMIPLSLELREAGADVICYGDLGVVPRSRFTIIDFEKDGARVAVGGAVGNYHVIQEFRSGEHPYFAVAEDLVRILAASRQEPNVAIG